jgi:hypothetical protein
MITEMERVARLIPRVTAADFQAQAAVAKRIAAIEARIAARQLRIRGPKMLTFNLPISAPSTANLREHHFAKARRIARQKSQTRLLCPKWNEGPAVRIWMTRISPRQLDSDNLAAALKAVRDGIASWLRIDDGSPLVEWRYEQEKGDEPCIRVEICVCEYRVETESSNARQNL